GIRVGGLVCPIPKILTDLTLPNSPKSPECPCRNHFFAGNRLGTQAKEAAPKSFFVLWGLGTLGTVGGSKVANVSTAPLNSWAGLDRPVLFAVALVEAFSQLREWGKLNAALIARFPPGAAPILLQRDGNDLRGLVFEIGRERPSSRIEALALVFAGGNRDGGVGRIRAGQDPIVR